MANEKLNSQVVARRSFLKKWYKTNCPLNGMAGAGNCIGAGFEPANADSDASRPGIPI